MNNISNVERKSSIELLRIISMLLIIAHHYACHGGFDFINTPFSKKLFFVLHLIYYSFTILYF